jgi:hypothetical protein
MRAPLSGGRRSEDSMGGKPHWCRGHLAWLQAGARRSAAELERCAAIVERWNAAQRTIGRRPSALMLTAECRWLHVYCGSCRQVKLVDLASVDDYPQAGLTSLILLLWCRPTVAAGPLPWLVGLSRFPIAAGARGVMPRRSSVELRQTPPAAAAGRSARSYGRYCEDPDMRRRPSPLVFDANWTQSCRPAAPVQSPRPYI